MKIVFLMDDIDSIHPFKDSTYMFMLACSRKGFEVFYLPNTGLGILNGQVIFSAQKVIPSEDRQSPFTYQDWHQLTGDEVSAVFIRTDPPFDENYLMNTWILDRLPNSVQVFNRPSGVRTVNEKIWATQFTDLVPPTLITSDLSQAHTFLNLHQHIVAKPCNGFGGASVFILRQGDSNVSVIFETLSANGHQKMILQSYIPEADQGDKRILLLNGEPLGAVLRVHKKGEHRNNFFAGGSAVRTDITARDILIISTLKPYLLELGLAFVGIDIIGNYLIEINVTSPTCIQEINHLNHEQLEDKIIDVLLR